MQHRSKFDISQTQASLILWISLSVYVTLLTVLCILKFRAFSYEDFDLAMHAQVIWNILHGSIYNSILGVDFPANHMHLVSFLIAPVYAVFPHPFTLLFLQSLALGIAVCPLYLLARSALGYKWALVIGLMYLIYPCVGFVNLCEFHPVAFSTAFLLFMLYYFEQDRFGMYLLFMFLAMSCQENIPLVVVAMGIYALIYRRKFHWVFVPILSGAIYFLLCVGVIMPYFNKGIMNFIGLYGYLGDSYGKIVLKIIMHPISILKIMVTKHKVLYLNKLFGPVLYLPLLSPASLVPLIPLLFQHLLSNRAPETFINYHYTAEMIPFIFLGVVYGIKNILSLGWLRERQRIFAGFLFLFACTCSFHLGPYMRLAKIASVKLERNYADLEKEQFLKKVPHDAAVVSTFEFLSHLANRKRLYSFHHVYTGVYTFSTKPYYLPEDTQFVLLNFDDRIFKTDYKIDRCKNIVRALDPNNWGVCEVADSIVLFEKGAKNKYWLYSVLPSEPRPQHDIRLNLGGEIELLGYDSKEEENGCLQLVLYWKAISQTKADINLFFYAVDRKNVVAETAETPVCYRIYPTTAWQKGQFIAEGKYLTFPYYLPEGRYTIMMVIFDKILKKAYTPDSSDRFGRIYLAQIDVNDRNARP